MSSRKRWHLFFCKMKEIMICPFFCHRNVDVTENLYATTTAEILKAVEFGCRIFYFGGYGDFDELCYTIVTKIKEENPQLNLQRVYCVSQERYLRKRRIFLTPKITTRLFIFPHPSMVGIRVFISATAL